MAELNPDRLSVFNYAHLPTLFAAQRKIKDADLPSAQQKLDILQETIASLTETGYQFIGMDHFARPDDELAIAQREGVLHRNFQGYTTQGDTDLLGMGVSAISMIGDCYAQNQKELKLYYQQVDETGNALWRGIALTRDDCIRRDVIKALICNFRLEFPRGGVAMGSAIQRLLCRRPETPGAAGEGRAGGCVGERGGRHAERTSVDS